MQVFIIDNPLYTALVLDVRRFHAQIREAKIVIKWCTMIKNGNSRWVNQPLVQMYINNLEWLETYIKVFEAVKNGDVDLANEYNRIAMSITPNWHSQDYYTQMKKRLYTKNQSHYKQWSYLGVSYDNWYYVNGQWRFYKQNK